MQKDDAEADGDANSSVKRFMLSKDFSVEQNNIWRCFALAFKCAIKNEEVTKQEWKEAYKKASKSENGEDSRRFWKELYVLSRKHGSVSIVYEALKHIIIAESKENESLSDISKTWSESAGKAITKEILFDNELGKIRKSFANEKIQFVALKGILIKELYPKKGMRQFCDYDILIHPEDADRVKAIMKSLGYSVSNDGKSEKNVHEAYNVIECKKQPIFNIEIHKKLFFGYDTGYFSQIWNRIDSTPNKAKACEREAVLPCDSEENNGEINLTPTLSDEDIYLFHIAHFCSHFNERSGAGIRYLADHYLLKNKLCAKDGFNREYVELVLQSENLLEFETQIDAVTHNLFNSKGDEIDFNALEEFLINGVHGTIDNKVKKQLAKESKFKYVLKRAFPPYKRMCLSFRILEKLPFLLPFCWVVRLFIVLFSNERRRLAKSEINQTKKKR